MTQTSISTGLYFPTSSGTMINTGSGTNATIDAATEKFACIGRIYINGRPAGAKTLSTGTIQYRTSTVTFANGGTTVDIGIQDVSTSGPIAQPDGVFDVKTTLTGGGGGITTTAWNTATMTTGSKSISHGDLIAVVFDMTARAGADSVLITAGVSSLNFPTTNTFISSAWGTTIAAGAGKVPNIVITFDDGTLGWFDGTIPFSSSGGVDTYATGTNPNERGMIFQVPWNCKIDQFWAWSGQTDANSDLTFKLYSDPTGTPALIASQAFLAEQAGQAGQSLFTSITLGSEISLTRNTDYAVTMLATGSTNARLISLTLGNAAHRVVFPGGTTLAKATRNGSTGAFTAENPAVTIYYMGVRISSFDNGTGPGFSASYIG